MVYVHDRVQAVIDTLPAGLKKAHETVVTELKNAAKDGKHVIIFADKDPDGASAHGLADIARSLGVKSIDVYHVDRDDVRFTEPATYVVYDISVTDKHLKDVHPEARIINVDHHDLAPRGGFPKHPQLAVAANPFYTDRTIRRFVEAEAKAYKLSIEDLQRIADVFELAERFPKDITTDEIVEKYLSAVRNGQPVALLRDEKICKLNEEWRKTLGKYLKRIHDSEFTVKKIPVGDATVKIAIIHVDPEDERRIQKIKSAGTC